MASSNPARPIPLTEARKRLFQLAEAVLSGATPRVHLSHRDRDDAVVLIAAIELEKLERDLAVLRSHGGIRSLRGIGKLTNPDEDPLAAIRARQRELSKAKLASLASPGGGRRALRASEPNAASYDARRKRR